MLGVDLNALAHFVTTVRTTPLSQVDETQLLGWADSISQKLDVANTPGQNTRAIPHGAEGAQLARRDSPLMLSHRMPWPP